MKARSRKPLGTLASALEVISGTAATPGQLLQFGRYLELIVTWNRTQALTGFRSAGDIVKGLLLDSLLFLPLLPARRPLKVLDLGAGAGIPGIPLRIIDEGLRLTAVEARRKRVSFLSTVKRDLRLEGVEIIPGRAELVIQERPDLEGAQDVVVARAVKAPAGLIRLADGFLGPGGLLVASGPPPGAPRESLPGGVNAEWREVRYPALGLIRTFLVYVKRG